jgi:hypothetical protein
VTEWADYYVGLDLGQSADYTALAVIQRVRTYNTLARSPSTTATSRGAWRQSRSSSSGGGRVRSSSASATPEGAATRRAGCLFGAIVTRSGIVSGRSTRRKV